MASRTKPLPVESGAEWKVLMNAQGRAPATNGAAGTGTGWTGEDYQARGLTIECCAGGAGATAGDEEESQICLHFVFCKPLAGVALSNATLGPITRDKRWGRHLGDVLEKKDLEAMGLHEPRELAPLEQATERPQSQERRSVPSISASREKDDDEDK